MWTRPQPGIPDTKADWVLAGSISTPATWIRNCAKADGTSNWDRKELFWRRTGKPGKIGDKSVNRFDKKQLQRNPKKLGDMVGQNHWRCWRFTCKRRGFKIKGIQCFEISFWSIEGSILLFWNLDHKYISSFGNLVIYLSKL